MSEETSLNTVELATELTIAWLGNQNNRVTADEVPAFLRTMHTTISELSRGSDAADSEQGGDEVREEFVPAVRYASRWGPRITSSP